MFGSVFDWLSGKEGGNMAESSGGSGGGWGEYQTAKEKTEYQGKVTTPVAMKLSPEYRAMMNEFLAQYYGYPSPTKQEQKRKKTLEKYQRKHQETLNHYEELLRQRQAQGQNVVGLQRKIEQQRNKVAEYDVRLKVFEKPEPRYITEAEETARGIREAAARIPDYMQEHAGLVPEAYRAAGEQYGGTMTGLIEGAMAGQSFLPDLPEGLLDKLSSTVGIGFGGKRVGDFMSKGSAGAIADILGTRTTERTNVMSLLGELAGERRDASVVPAEQEYQYGLLPLQTQLEHAQQFPTNLGFLSALSDLRGLWEPMKYATTILGGQVPIKDEYGKAKGSGWGTAGGGGR